ncbi:ead/Ea22-like family protein [Enterobacter asburiae]|uniref:ead/Ea22-like family protein n=1 Tax=Enterobacter asburiae TaxID=61645 RepID=UPI0011D2545B|nr:ead/Ea22-like family protein [Enterobacter asburiae]
MSNIDKLALREAAEKALPAMKRLLMMPNDELFDEALLNVDGDVDAANAFNLLTGPETVLALLDELEAKDRMVAEFLNIISRHTIELGWGEKPITLAELIIYREGSGSDALDAIRAAAAGKGE